MENIINSEYTEIMQQSYIDYAMSVIVSRALPDVRDGLKPVQRRTLYDMMQLGIRWDKPFRKSARIVGDTMGRFHPHGDSSIYESLVVMSQDYKKGLPLVEGHGNFGSIEGDGAAAMRYTEARLQKVTQDAFLSDLDKNIIDFMPNFDQNEEEPTVLPAKIPNLLINGTEGIAVGMATNIPPHNLKEVIEATKQFIKNPDISEEALLKVMTGPDFPTGGIIINKDELLHIYHTGSGKLRIRGKVERETLKSGKEALVITEIPYTMIGAGIGKFLNDVANLIEDKTAADIADISNQSGKEGIRIVLELKKNADADNVENMLYKKTKLEDTFGVNMLAVANGKPEVLGLKAILEHFTAFQYSILTRKYQNLLAEAEKKREIQEGLIKAVDLIDLIIEILRGSKNIKQVKNCLISGITEGIQFKKKNSEKAASKLAFTETQATAILALQLHRLIGLELEALQKEHRETLKVINFCHEILENRSVMTDTLIKELNRLKKEYGVPRKTLIENREEAVYKEKVIIKDLTILIDRLGYIKSVEQSIYERNKEAADNENHYILSCTSLDRICIFSSNGSLHTLKASDIPFGKFRDKGIPIDNLCNFNSTTEQILYVDSSTNLSQSKLLFLSQNGMGKLVEGSEFVVSRKEVSATKLLERDQLIFVQKIQEEDTNVVLCTKKGAFLRFALEEIPLKKKIALGVPSIQLAKDDQITQCYLIPYQSNLFINYFDKEIPISRIKLGKRESKGTKLRL